MSELYVCRCDKMNNIIVYTSRICGNCQELKKYLKDAKIAYEERDITVDEHYVSYFSDKLTKSDNYEDRSSLELPAIVIDGKFYPYYSLTINNNDKKLVMRILKNGTFKIILEKLK